MRFLRLNILKDGLIQQAEYQDTTLKNELRFFYQQNNFLVALEELKITFLNSWSLEAIIESKIVNILYSKDNRFRFEFIPQSIFDPNATSLIVDVSIINTYFANSRAYLKNIINNLPYAIFWKDLHSNFLGCNTAFARSADLNSAEEIVGKTDYDMPWKEYANDYIEMDKKVICLKKPVINFEEKNLNMILLVSKVPMFDERKNVIGVLGVYTDITEKKRAEQLLKEKEIAEKNAELMNILSSSVAHEIRTPLSIIQINANLMQLLDVEEISESAEQKKRFLLQTKNICQAVKECSQVINMLLVKLKKVSTVSNKEKKELLTLCSINDTIQKAIKEYPFRENEKINYMPIVEFSYHGDERLIKHVLFNLIRNALNAMGEAQKGEIFIECKTGKKMNKLIFTDTASGVSPNYLPKIFNKFETTDEAHSGTGLGLAFCKLVMESFGGQIECRSELNKFTEFTLSFPATEFAFAS